MTPTDNPTIPYGYCHCGCGLETNKTKQAIKKHGYKQGEPSRFVLGHNRRGLIGSRTRHGHAKHGAESRAYRCWLSMKGRCLNINHQNYSDYGGRGISICDRWLKFEAFIADMGNPPDGKSIDRINNNGNYEPENCRWATASEQQRNTRKSRKLT